MKSAAITLCILPLNQQYIRRDRNLIFHILFFCFFRIPTRNILNRMKCAYMLILISNDDTVKTKASRFLFYAHSYLFMNDNDNERK